MYTMSASPTLVVKASDPKDRERSKVYTAGPATLLFGWGARGGRNGKGQRSLCCGRRELVERGAVASIDEGGGASARDRACLIDKVTCARETEEADVQVQIPLKVRC